MAVEDINLGFEIPDRRLGHGKGEFLIANWPFFWITRVSHRYFQVLERRLKPIGLDVPGWRVLLCLRETSWLSVTEIADTTIIKLNTATKIIKRMASQGLVTTRSRPGDLRVTEVMMTEEGERLICQALDIAETIYRAAFDGLTADEERMLNQVTEHVFDRLDKF